MTGPRAAAPTERGRRTRDRLLAAAAEVIADRGAAAASVAAIAERAGVSAGALYRHFPSKEDLLRELFAAVADRELEAMRAAGEGTGSRLAQIDTVLATYATHALDSPRLAWALVYEPVAGGLDAERLAHRRRYTAELADLIGTAIGAGELPGQDPELSAAAVVGAMAEALLGPLSSPRGPGDEPELSAEVVGLCRRILGAPGRVR